MSATQSPADVSFEDALRIYQNASAEKSVYADLPPSTTNSLAIRVLRLIAAPKADSPLFATLMTTDLLSENRLSYRALSYAWGDIEMSQYVICLDEDGWERIPITSNLCTILYGMRGLSDGTPSSETFWVDALCISQSRDERGLKERAHQVRCMNYIFAKASSVIAYIGDVDEKDYIELSNALTVVAQNHDAVVEEIESTTLPSQLISNPGRNSSLIRALLALTASQYFNRIWTYQEFILPGQVDFMINNTLWSNHTMTDMLQLLQVSFQSSGGFDYDGPESYDAFRAIQGWGYKHMVYQFCRQSYHQDREKYTTCELLSETFDAQATDPRDRLFAVYGLLTENSWGSAIPIPVDYMADVDMLSIETSKLFLLGADQYKLFVFRFCCCLSSKLPSWCVDLRRTEHVRYTPIVALFPHRMPCLFTACGTTEVDMQIGSSQNELSVLGSIIDCVQATGPVIMDPRTWPTSHWGDPQSAITAGINNVKAIESWFEPLLPNLTSAEKFDMKWRTLCCDTTVGQRSLRRANINDACNYRCHLWLMGRQCGIQFEDGEQPEADKSSKNEEWCKAHFDICGGRKLVITEAQRTAAVPPDTVAGDNIVIFSGVAVPFVVRRQLDLTYRLVGECYLHGVMDGEILRTASWSPKTILIS